MGVEVFSEAEREWREVSDEDVCGVRVFSEAGKGLSEKEMRLETSHMSSPHLEVLVDRVLGASSTTFSVQRGSAGKLGVTSKPRENLQQYYMRVQDGDREYWEEPKVM